MRNYNRFPESKHPLVAATPEVRTESLRQLVDYISQLPIDKNLVDYQNQLLYEADMFRQNKTGIEKRMAEDTRYGMNYPLANVQANQIWLETLDKKISDYYQYMRNQQLFDANWLHLQGMLQNVIAWAPQKFIIDMSCIPKGVTPQEIIATYRKTGLSLYTGVSTKQVYDEWSEWAMCKLHFAQIEYLSKHYPLLYANSPLLANPRLAT